MDLQDFRTLVVSEINEEYADSLERREAYISEVVRSMIDSSQCDGFNPFYYHSTGKNNKIIEIYGYNYGEFDGTLSIFIGNYNGTDNPEPLTKTEIEKMYNRAKYFVQGAYDETIFQDMKPESAEYYAAKNILQFRSDIQRYRFYIITDGSLGKVTIKNLDYEFIDGKSTQLSIIDISTYCDVVSDKKSSLEIEIDFESYGYDGISCIKANEISAGADYDAYLCVLPGKLLADIYIEFGAQLLESNVRSFLTAKGKVNKGIKRTIQDEPTRFFAYNNGLTTTASEIYLKDGPAGLRISKIKGLQIVNGGQTTASIAAVTRDPKNPVDISDIYVPMKICKIPEDNSEDFSRNISQYSNFQNKVSNSDFYSNFPFHKKLETISRRVNAPAIAGSIYSTRWYYERARGSYVQEMAGMKQSDINKFQRQNPKKQIITKTDIAKYRCTYQGMPHIVSKGPQTCIIKYAEIMDNLWNSSDSTVPGAKINDNYFKETVAIAIMYKDLEAAVFDKTLSPWYVGYRQNIVSYSIAKLVYMLDQYNASINLTKIWDEQTICQELRNQLLVIAERVNEIINDPNRPYQIVTEYCKREVCWENIKKESIELSPNTNVFAITERKERYGRRIAQRDETQHQRMMANIEVVSKGDEFWQNVLNWGIEEDLLNRDERQVLSVAANANRYRKPPSEKQAVWILKIYDRLCKEGFRG